MAKDQTLMFDVTGKVLDDGTIGVAVMDGEEVVFGCVINPVAGPSCNVIVAGSTAPDEADICPTCPAEKAKEQNKIKRWVNGGWKIVKSELGMDKADDLTQRERKHICSGCEHFNFGECNSCGCILPIKITLKGESCPEGKW